MEKFFRKLKQSHCGEWLLAGGENLRKKKKMRLILLNNDRKEFRKEMEKKSHCVADFIEKVLKDHIYPG